jgi:soluble lytic murein transglycosylase-like protein
VDRGRVAGAAEAARDPGQESAAADRDNDGVELGQILREFQPDRAVAGHDRVVLDRVDEEPLGAVEPRLDDRLPPALVRHLDDAAAEPPDRVQLGLRRVVGHDDRRRHPELPRRPRDALRHVSGARCHDPARDRLASRGPDRVDGAADLERADRLQVLELEPDLCRRVVDGKPDERRPDRGPLDPPAGGLDLGERDHGVTVSVRIPRVLAPLAAALVLAGPPPPNAPLPTGIEATAARLTATTRSLHRAVAEWRGTGTARQPRELRLWALDQQRLYLRLGLAPRSTGDAIVRLTAPTTLPLSAFRTGPAAPADRLLAFDREAERRFGVPWHVLAAVNFVETAFGKVRSRSSAGAQGPMQFLPATWRVYGLGGDVHDPHDAILGAANMLRANGAPRKLRRALYAYNHSDRYVDAVVAYAAVIRRSRTAYYGFHAWQVFVRTASGYRRLTDP